MTKSLMCSISRHSPQSGKKAALSFMESSSGRFMGEETFLCPPFKHGFFQISPAGGRDLALCKFRGIPIAPGFSLD